jgi:phosphoglycerate dehydrogenase-like enzyme
MSPAELDDLKSVAPEIDPVVCRGAAQAIEQAPGAVACYGFITRDLIRAGRSLRWVQQPSAGVEGLMEIPSWSTATSS